MCHQTLYNLNRQLNFLHGLENIIYRSTNYKESPWFLHSKTTDYFFLVLLQSVLGIILGGGAGTRLYPLTKKRAKPAVPLGANYRLIDIPVSNCLNSNVSKIYVLTQFNSASLNRHLSRAYASNMGGYKNEGFVEVLAAQQSPENPNWFQVLVLPAFLLFTTKMSLQHHTKIYALHVMAKSA